MNLNNFIEELKKINIEITDLQLEQLNKYYELLVEYNKVMNLTGITELEQVYLKHFYDSLTLTKVIDPTKEESLCDVGTGAGFPGLVIKILFPNLKVTLVDSLNKRIEFLKTVIKYIYTLFKIKEYNSKCLKDCMKNEDNKKLLNFVQVYKSYQNSTAKLFHILKKIRHKLKCKKLIYNFSKNFCYIYNQVYN